MAKKSITPRKFWQNNVDEEMNKKIEEEISKIEEKLKIEIEIFLEMDTTNGIRPVLKYLKK